MLYKTFIKFINILDNIKTQEDLFNFIKAGSKNYSALSGLTTNKGVEGGEKYSIDGLLANENNNTANKMVYQVLDKTKILLSENVLCC